MEAFFTTEALYALGQVLAIDLLLAGDNAIAVGLAAAGLPAADRRKAILYGLIAAVVLRIGFALITVQLLAVVGLLFAGGLLLLYVCWRMWHDLRAGHSNADEVAEAGLADATGASDKPAGAAALAAKAPAKSFRGAFLQILLADVSMSLDNVLAVAGAAREHPEILIFGLLFSIALMGVAATWIARLLHRFIWLGYVGLLIVFYVALHMMWDGAMQVAVRTDNVAAWNQTVPGTFGDISPRKAEELAGDAPAEH